MQLKHSIYRRHQQAGNGDTYSESESIVRFLAVTKQLYEWYFLSVSPSVCHTVFTMFPSSYHREILLVINNDQVRSMQKVKVRGQRSRSQRSTRATVNGCLDQNACNVLRL